MTDTDAKSESSPETVQVFNINTLKDFSPEKTIQDGTTVGGNRVL